jgi:hypothetical protein
MSEDAAIYRNANGDVWYLVPDVKANRIWIRHQPNQASGRQSSLVDLGTFLSEGHGPQHKALPRLLQELGYLLPAP